MKPVNFTFLCVAYVLLVMLILPGVRRNIEEYAGKKVEMLDMKIAYSAEEAFQIFDSYTSQGRGIYLLAELSAGFVYPMVYGLLYGSLIFFLANRRPFKGLVGHAFLLPYTTMILAWLESTFLVSAIIAYPSKSIFIIQVSSCFSLLKWSSIVIVLLIIMILAIYNFLSLMRIIKL